MGCRIVTITVTIALYMCVCVQNVLSVFGGGDRRLDAIVTAKRSVNGNEYWRVR